jgi:hypothetical protein
MKTVWIYVDTSKEVGDLDHLKDFKDEDAAEAWFKENDPEGVAFGGTVAEHVAVVHGAGGVQHFVVWTNVDAAPFVSDATRLLIIILNARRSLSGFPQ